MSSLDQYAFTLCLIMFLLMVGTFTFLVTYIIKLWISLIRHGCEDEAIKKELSAPPPSKGSKALDCAATLFLCILLLAVFAFTLYVNLQEDVYFEKLPTLKVVASSSMEKKHEDNTYLTEHGLNNQFAMFDLVLTYRIPDEFELELYDIVVYETDDGLLVIHRIVEIEEPNAFHPDSRWFTCQGDAINVPDKRPVRYEQMHAIYRDERVPFVGSIISFFQSPVGWLCFVLIFFVAFITPFLQKMLQKEKLARMAILAKKKTPKPKAPPAPVQVTVHQHIEHRSTIRIPVLRAKGQTPADKNQGGAS